jgi:hypothetical protein
MKYQKLIETISLILDNEKIEKRGLTLCYELPQNELLALNEEIFYLTNPFSTKFEPSDEFEVLIGSILIKFKKN